MKKKRKTRKKAARKTLSGAKGLSKLLPGKDASKLKGALKDVLGVVPSEIQLKLSPGGARAGDGSWDGNIYKYRY